MTTMIPGNDGPCIAASNQVQANSAVVLSLCAGPNLPGGTIPVAIDAHPGPRQWPRPLQ